MTPQERKAVMDSPNYLEAWTLMQYKNPKAIEKWQKAQLKEVKKNYQSKVSASMLSTYEVALANYVAAVQNKYGDYNNSRTSEARRESILIDLVLKDRRSLTNASHIIEKQRASAPKVKATPPQVSSGKKSGFFKKLLVGTGIVGALWFFGGSKNNSASHEGDSSAPRITHSGGSLNRTLHQGSNGGVVQSGNTYVADSSLTDSAKGTFARNMNYSTTPSSASAFDSEMQAMDQHIMRTGKQVTISGHAAQTAWNTASAATAIRETNYQEQNMKVDTMRSWEDVSYATRNITRNLKDTTHEARGFFNGFKDMFKRPGR